MAPVNTCSVHFNISYPVKGNELCWQNCGNFLHGVSIGFFLQYPWKRAVRIRFWMFGGKPCDVYRLHFNISYPVEGNELRWQNCGNFLHHLAVQHIMPWKFDLLLKSTRWKVEQFCTYIFVIYFYWSLLGAGHHVMQARLIPFHEWTLDAVWFKSLQCKWEYTVYAPL